MIRIPLTSLLAAAALLNAAPVHAQHPPAVHALVTLTGEASNLQAVSPNGRFALVSQPNELLVYDIGSAQSWKLAEATASQSTWSPKGDMVAWVQAGDGGIGEYVWAVAVDPRTGRPRGMPQRVTIGQGELPALSFDSKWIAYSAPDVAPGASLSGDMPTHLAIVPATGGPERVLARFDGWIANINWSPDGGTIYFRTAATLGVSRVRVRGGAPEVLRSGGYLVGMTANRRYIIIAPGNGLVQGAGTAATVIDTTGKEIGRIPMPDPGESRPLPLYLGILGDSAILLRDIKERRVLELAPLTGAASRRVPLVGESDGAPTWSPDGRRIAFVAREGTRNLLGVMNSDGRTPYLFRETNVAPPLAGSGSGWWSPDGKYVAVASVDAHVLFLVDVVGKSVRSLVSDTAAAIGMFQWRADSRALVVGRYAGRGSTSTWEQVTLSGERRTLAKDSTSRPLGQFHTSTLVGGPKLYWRTDSAAYLEDPVAGTMRRLVAVPAGSYAQGHGVSHDLKWVAAPVYGGERENQIELISLESGERRVLDLPFKLPALTAVAFGPGDRSVLVAGRPAADAAEFKLYSVPLDGGQPSVIGGIGPSSITDLSVSPDGKSVIYSRLDQKVTSILSIDLRPALAAATSRAQRR